MYKNSADAGADTLASTFMTLYFAYLLANMLIGVPENHVSTGVHQTVGPCNVTDLDLAGHERQVGSCNEPKAFSKVGKRQGRDINESALMRVDRESSKIKTYVNKSVNFFRLIYPFLIQ